MQKSVGFCLYTLAWIGLGTPTVWLNKYDPAFSTLYKLLQYGSSTLLLVVFFYACLAQHVVVIQRVKNSRFLCLFLAYTLISLLWAPADLSRQGVLLLTLVLCISAAFAADVYLGWEKTWAIITFSLLGYLSCRLAMSFTQSYLSMSSIKIIYLTGFIGWFYIVYLQFLSNFLKKSNFFLFVAICVIILGLTIAALLVESTNIPLIANENGWRIRPDYGLFSNPNLFNRFLQVLLMASLVTVTSYGLREDGAFSIVTAVALLGVFASGIVLVEQKASTGRLVMVATIFACAGGFLLASLRQIGIKSVLLFTSIAILLCVVFAVATPPGYIGGIMDAFLERQDLLSRTRIWHSALGLLDVKDRVFGVGFGGFWPNLQDRTSVDPALIRTAHAHNGFIDLIIHVGVVGTFLFCCAFVFSFFSKVKIITGSTVKEHGVELAALIALAGLVAMNLLESALLPISSAAILPFSLLIFVLSHSGRERPICSRPCPNAQSAGCQSI